jgi:golgi phosphoprotein 3
MSGGPALRVHEQLLLLALHDEKGTLQSAPVAYGLAGALVAELMVEGRIAEPADDSDPFVVRDGSPLGDALLDRTLERIATARTRHSPARTVALLAANPHLVDATAGRLCSLGILRREEGRFLLVFPRTLYPTADAGPEQRLLAEITAALEGRGEAEPRLEAVIAIAHAARILEGAIGRSVEWRDRGPVKAMVDCTMAAKATRLAIEVAQLWPEETAVWVNFT